MKALVVILTASLFLVSCSDEPVKTELEQELEIVNKDKINEQKAIKDTKPVVQQPQYKVGEHYEVLAKPYPTENNEQVVIFEFFGYSCPHCFHFEPYINKWLPSKADFIKYQRVPLNFNQGWGVYQQAYLTAQTMNIGDEAHKQLFEAIHNKHKHFTTIDQLGKWYAENFTIDENNFISTADSFIIDSQQRKADKMGFLMGITATPSVVVNGKYKVSKKVRDRDDIIKVMNFLAKKEAKEMGLISK